jgi:hypothetical protein
MESMLSNVASAIDELYVAFSSQPKPSKIDACPCCLSAGEICTLLDTPLRRLSPEHLSGFAASVLLTAGSEQDLRYFFPRMMDIVIHERGWWPDREVVLGKLSIGHWHTWSEREQSAIINAVREAFQADLHDESDGAWSIDSWLCGLALAGADVQPFLRTLGEPPNEAALFAYYELNSAPLRKGKLGNSFWAGNRHAQEPIVTWLNSAPIQQVVVRLQQQRYG